MIVPISILIFILTPLPILISMPIRMPFPSPFLFLSLRPSLYSSLFPSVCRFLFPSLVSSLSVVYVSMVVMCCTSDCSVFTWHYITTYKIFNSFHPFSRYSASKNEKNQVFPLLFVPNGLENIKKLFKIVPLHFKMFHARNVHCKK